METSRVWCCAESYTWGQSSAVCGGASEQVVGAEARISGPHWNRLSFLLHKKRQLLYSRSEATLLPPYTHGPWAGSVLTGPLGALVLWPDHQPLSGNGPVVALWGVQCFFHPCLQVLSGDEVFCLLLLGERRPAELSPQYKPASWLLAH